MQSRVALRFISFTKGYIRIAFTKEKELMLSQNYLQPKCPYQFSLTTWHKPHAVFHSCKGKVFGVFSTIQPKPFFPDTYLSLIQISSIILYYPPKQKPPFVLMLSSLSNTDTKALHKEAKKRLTITGKITRTKEPEIRFGSKTCLFGEQ